MKTIYEKSKSIQPKKEQTFLAGKFKKLFAFCTLKLRCYALMRHKNFPSKAGKSSLMRHFAFMQNYRIKCIQKKLLLI